MGAKGLSAAVAAVAALALSFKVLLGGLSKKAYDGLNGVISFSSKLIAATRAVEAAEEHALVFDPLAARMAGQEALASSRRRAQAAPEGSERKYKVGKMAIRTRWFDDQIEAALGMPVSATIPGVLRAASAPSRVDLPSYVWSHPDGHEPRQLVMLGAGMDSRPWRMKLPADLAWFELDQGDVVGAKRALLHQLAAEVPEPEERVEAQEEPMSPKFVDSGLARHTSIDEVQFPLRCGSWAAVACDLSDPAWSEALVGAGFDPRKPTVWVAEGLLMYLEESKVQGMLRKVAELSEEGSVFIGLSVTLAVIDRLRARGKGSGVASSLMDQWVFGCPEDPTQFLAACGWQLQLATDRLRQAAALGLDPELCAFPTKGGASEAEGGTSLFMVATPTAAPKKD